MMTNNNKISTKYIIILTLAALIIGIVSDIFHNSSIKFRWEVSGIERIIKKIESRTDKQLDVFNHIKNDSLALESELGAVQKKGEIIVLNYLSGSLAGWSDKGLNFPSEFDTALFNHPLIRIEQTWLIVREVESGPNIFVGLIPIRYEYQITNEYLRPGFAEALGLPGNAEFSLIENMGYPVYDSDNEYLFSLTFDQDRRFVTILGVVPVVFWLIFVGCLLVLVNRTMNRYRSNGAKVSALLINLAVPIILYTLFLVTGKPEIIGNLAIFGSDRFTLGRLIPSPGHMLLVSAIFFHFTVKFREFISEWNAVRTTSRSGNSAIFFVLLIVIGILFFLFFRVLTSYISISNINFDIYKIVDIDFFTVVSILSSALILVGITLFLNAIMKLATGLGFVRIIAGIIVMVAVTTVLIYAGGESPLEGAVLLLLLAILSWFGSVRKIEGFNYSVLVALVAAIFMSIIIPERSAKREDINLKVLAVNYCTDNDIYAESLLLDIWDKIKTDTVLSVMLKQDYFSGEEFNEIYNYLDNKYFDDYWENYNVFYTICNSQSPLIVEGDYEVDNCFGFFNQKIEEFGSPVVDSSLVFLENRSGRAYYLASLFFPTISGETNGLFIELINQVKYVQSGYPGLLVNEKYFKQPGTNLYSFAKYYDDTLAIQTGSYTFEPVMRYPNDRAEEFNKFTRDGTDFLIYNSSEDATMIITKPSSGFIDKLVTFTYLFVFLFLIYFLSGIITRDDKEIRIADLNFRKRIQYAFFTILLGSVVAIGSVVVILSINQYRQKHLENIREKLSSVLIELEHKLSEETSLSNDWSGDGYATLDDLLVKFSNVFYTDINLYSVDGELLATSRRELFDKGLAGARMDYQAYTRLAGWGIPEYIHEERIGKLSYLSAYSLFINNRNEILAYLNLPYFTVQSKLTEEVSNLVVAIVNFSLILIVIATGIAVFISNRLTSPLRMLQVGLASVKFGEEGKPLEYKGSDEIGELVNQYNKMVEELHISAMKLARSERELAWREMAKQVAHEIKNPLTPMKLNVQQLLKSWKDRDKEFTKRLERFSDTQIEQIDNLSSIATEFSNFARIPKARPVRINLNSQIESIAELFRDTVNIEFKVKLPEGKDVYIYADKEQLNSVLTNILRNATQSITSGKKGIIKISLSSDDSTALIKVEDNGSGIADSLKDKLFAPNFTTKSSGMGLGLAISKRIIESSDGRIWFESTVGTGSTFLIEFPTVD